MIVAAIAMLAVQSSIAVSVYGASVALAFLISLIHAGAMPLAMLRPGVGAVISVIACGLLPLLAEYRPGAPWPWQVPMMITQILIILIIGLRAHWGVALACLIGSVVVSVVDAFVGTAAHPQSSSHSATINIVVFSCIAGGVYIAAIIVQQWQLIRSQLVREKENTADEQSKRIVVEEKTRIARELHDIIAHSMSIINIQATSAPYRHQNMAAEVEKEFADISASARQALTEMRGLLSVLRNDEAGQELAPQPKLSDVDQLIRQAKQVGVRVSLERTGDGGDERLRDSTSLAGYRIVQEALSNAIRHARGSNVLVKVHIGESAVRISVVNTAGRERTEPLEQEQRRHHGLIGMAERALSVGGDVRTGPTADGGFEVDAVLPLGTPLLDDSTGKGSE